MYILLTGYILVTPQHLPKKHILKFNRKFLAVNMAVIKLKLDNLNPVRPRSFFHHRPFDSRCAN